MKTAIVAVLLLGMASFAFALDPPKDPDTTDYVMEGTARLVIAGDLDGTEAPWHRWRGTFSDFYMDCTWPMTYEYTAEPFMDDYCFQVTDATAVEFVVDSADFDTVIYIYCADWDPLLPMDNCVGADDDDGDGLLSAIMATDNVTLTPGLDYYLVVCSYGAGYTGLYSISTSDNVVLCGTTSTEEAHWGAIKTLFR